MVVSRERIKLRACSDPFTSTVKVLICGVSATNEAPWDDGSCAWGTGIRVSVWGSPVPVRG